MSVNSPSGYVSFTRTDAQGTTVLATVPMPSSIANALLGSDIRIDWTVERDSNVSVAATNNIKPT
jgi:hypothetical protein